MMVPIIAINYSILNDRFIVHFRTVWVCFSFHTLYVHSCGRQILNQNCRNRNVFLTNPLGYHLLHQEILFDETNVFFCLFLFAFLEAQINLSGMSNDKKRIDINFLLQLFQSWEPIMTFLVLVVFVEWET